MRRAFATSSFAETKRVDLWVSFFFLVFKEGNMVKRFLMPIHVLSTRFLSRVPEEAIKRRHTLISALKKCSSQLWVQRHTWKMKIYRDRLVDFNVQWREMAEKMVVRFFFFSNVNQILPSLVRVIYLFKMLVDFVFAQKVFRKTHNAHWTRLLKSM